MVEVHFVDNREIDREVGELREWLTAEPVLKAGAINLPVNKLFALRDTYQLTPRGQGIVDRIEALIDLRRVD